MIDTYKYMNGHQPNIVRLLEMRRDYEGLMRKLQKHRKRLNNDFNKYIANRIASQGSTPNYNRGGWGSQ
jgi:hypothetical protein